MNPIKLTIIDPIECEVKAEDAMIFIKVLSYPKVFWKKKMYAEGKFGKEKINYIGSAFSFNKGPYWRFWTGLVPRIKTYLESSGTPLEIEGEQYWNDIYKSIHPSIPGETLREDQVEYINTCIEKTRGTIIAPTAYGKTFVQMGIVSALPSESFLILADKKVIVNQTYQNFIDHEYTDVQRITGDYPYKGEFKKIVIATRQSIDKINIPPDQFSCIMIDEVHHLSSFNCNYAQILRGLLAPFRWGFTGTYPDKDKPEHQLAIESFIGPVIGEMTTQEAAKKEIIAIPKIKIVGLNFSQAVKDLKTWHDVNMHGIQLNEHHNETIVDCAVQDMQEGRIVLIFVNTVEHALYIDSLFKQHVNEFKVKMVHSSIGATLQKEIKQWEKKLKSAGPLEHIDHEKFLVEKKTAEYHLAATKEQARRLNVNSKKQELYKQWLTDRKIHGVIATSTWREGINIPSIETIILGGGGKESQKILQEIGRGLRRAPGKKFVKVIDFFNPSHRFLIEHFGMRFMQYLDKKWEFLYD